MKALLLVVGLLWGARPLWAQAPTPREALRAVNQVRAMTGLAPLGWQASLAQAAQGHANYLSQTFKISHLQQVGQPGFLGVKPSDRALAVGYHSRMVWENISIGPPGLDLAMESLLGAVYHRFAFLRFEADEMGAGVTRQGENSIWVFLLGNREMDQLCAERPPARGTQYYFNFCLKNLKIGVKGIKGIQKRAWAKAPKVLVWPPDASRFIPPAFYDELPPPLPGRVYTGYPISLQLNPLQAAGAKLIEFTLKPAQGAAALAGQVLERSNDPNARLGPGEFVFFPFERLAWGKAFIARAVWEVAGKRESLAWRFAVTPAPQPLHYLEERSEAWVEAGKKHYFYLEPSPDKPILTEMRLENSKGVRARVQYLDKNTFSAQLQGPTCGWVKFHFLSQQSLNLRLFPQRGAKKCHPLPK